MGRDINAIPGSKVPDHNISIPKVLGLQLPEDPLKIPRHSPSIGTAHHHLNQPPKHLPLATLGIAPGPPPLQLATEPDLDPALLIDADHVLLDLEVPHPIEQLSEAPEGLVVEVQHVGVGDVLDVAQAQGDALEEDRRRAVRRA